MSALDHCEPQVIRAFEKAGWSIMSKPLVLDSYDRTFYADFSLQRRTNGTGEQIIVVEVKCFADEKHEMGELYGALGQYQFYRSLLAPNQIDASIFLAVPALAYERLASNPDIAQLLKSLQIRFVLIDLSTEEIVRWIS
jgi:hypothetical protein